jgi:hypothetical protein
MSKKKFVYDDDGIERSLRDISPAALGEPVERLPVAPNREARDVFQIQTVLAEITKQFFNHETPSFEEAQPRPSGR